MEPVTEADIKNFIECGPDDGGLCDFCTLSEECPKGMVCYGGEPIEPACMDMDERFIERHIDKEAIEIYLKECREQEENREGETTE